MGDVDDPDRKMAAALVAESKRRLHKVDVFVPLKLEMELTYLVHATLRAERQSLADSIAPTPPNRLPRGVGGDDSDATPAFGLEWVPTREDEDA